MDTHDIVRVLLAAALAWAAALNAYGPQFVLLEFERWAYPRWLRLGVAAAEFAAAALLLSPAFMYGSAIALMVLAGVIFSLNRDRAWLRMEYPAMLVALALATLIGI